MTTHEKQNMFETLELLRKTARRLPDFQGADWKDVDDWIFSELNLTIGDIDEIYAGRDSLVYAGSAIEGFAPVAPSYAELSDILKRAKHSCPQFVCMETDTPAGKMVVVRAIGYGSNIQLVNVNILTEADAPAIHEMVGAKVTFSGYYGEPNEIAAYVQTDSGPKLVFSVSEAQ